MHTPNVLYERNRGEATTVSQPVEHITVTPHLCLNQSQTATLLVTHLSLFRLYWLAWPQHFSCKFTKAFVPKRVQAVTNKKLMNSQDNTQWKSNSGKQKDAVRNYYCNCGKAYISCNGQPVAACTIIYILNKRNIGFSYMKLL